MALQAFFTSVLYKEERLYKESRFFFLVKKRLLKTKEKGRVNNERKGKDHIQQSI